MIIYRRNMEVGFEELERLKDLLQRRLRDLLALTEKGSPARAAAEEANRLWDEISALEATLDVLGDPDLRGDIEAGLREIAAGDVTPLESVRKKYSARERPPDTPDV